MSRRYVNQLSHGDSVDESYLVADKQLRANRQGNLYLKLELRDKTGSVGARLWNASEGLARLFEPGDYLHVRGKTQVFQGSLQIILNHLEVVDPNQVEAEDFLPQSSQNAAKLMARLREVLLTMNNPHLRALIECFLIDDDFVRKFIAAPGESRTTMPTREGCSSTSSPCSISPTGSSTSIPRSIGTCS